MKTGPATKHDYHITYATLPEHSALQDQMLDASDITHLLLSVETLATN